MFEFPAPPEWHPDAWVGRKAVQRVRQHQGPQPLFLWASFSGPHFPFDAPRPYLDRVQQGEVGTGSPWRGSSTIRGASTTPASTARAGSRGPGRRRAGPARLSRTSTGAAYGGPTSLTLALIDDQVGALLQAVQERFGERALVLFSTDHGEMLGNHRLWGKNNCAYEDVWNVPLLARYPRGAPGAALHGTVQEARVMLTDVAPTCLRAAGLEGAFPTDGLALEDQVARGGRAHVLAEGGGFLALSDGCTKYVSARRSGRRTIRRGCKRTPVALPGRGGAQRRGSAAGSCSTWWPTRLSSTTSWGARSTPSATCASRRCWKRPSWAPSFPERPAPSHPGGQPGPDTLLSA